MKLNFLKLPSEDRKLYIEEAAGRRGLSPVILEKDFWVCWLLHVLFDATFHDATRRRRAADARTAAESKRSGRDSNS